MKILVPTDFSSHAEFAFEAALKIAKKVGGEIHVFHAANIPGSWKAFAIDENISHSMSEAIKKYASYNLKVLNNNAIQNNVACSSHFCEDGFIESIKTIVDRYFIDLVVMGSHGMNGVREWMIGSNAQKCIRRLNVNVLVIKKPLRSLKFKNVAFVSNLSREDIEAFHRFLEFLRPFENVKVHIVSVDTFGWHFHSDIIFAEAIREFKEASIGYNCETHTYKDYTVDAGVRHFIDEHKIDLIAISNHKRHPLKRFYQGSNVEMLVNHSDIPVLSIDY